MRRFDSLVAHADAEVPRLFLRPALSSAQSHRHARVETGPQDGQGSRQARETDPMPQVRTDAVIGTVGGTTL